VALAVVNFVIERSFYEDPPVWEVLQREIKREAVLALSRLGFLDHSTMQMRVQSPEELVGGMYFPSQYLITFEAEVYA
jgi:hypothetical protein